VDSADTPAGCTVVFSRSFALVSSRLRFSAILADLTRRLLAHPWV